MIKETVITISYWKSFGYLPFVTMCVTMFEYLHLNTVLMTLLVVLMVLDFLSGWYKSYRLNIAITKSRLVAGFYAKIFVFVILIVLGILIVALNEVNPKVVAYLDMTSYISGISFFMILNEIYSILGNIQSGRTQEEIQEIDFITLLIRKVRGKFESKMDCEVKK